MYTHYTEIYTATADIETDSNCTETNIHYHTYIVHLVVN